MFIDVLNGKDSKIDIKTESDLIRLALLMSDRVGVAGKCSDCLNVNNYFVSTQTKENLKYLKFNVEQMLKHDPDLKRDFQRAFEDYTHLLNRKNKNKSEVLKMLNAKFYIDDFRRMGLDAYKQVAHEYKIEDIVPFSTTMDEIITVRFFGIDAENNVKLGINVLERMDSFIIFDKSNFEEPVYAGFTDAADGFEEVFNNVSSPGFLSGGMVSTTIPHGLSFDHFKVIREGLISETEGFRNSLMQTKEILNRTKFSKENIRVFVERYNITKQQASAFEKIGNENFLLNKLSDSGKAAKSVKISFAVTSYSNLILILERLDIINKRETLYIREGISQLVDPAMSIAFLTAEEDD